MIWERNGEAYYATLERLSGEVLFHLIVEQTPDGAWDWAVWASDGTYEASGMAPILHVAMLEGEKNAKL
jgi:hypothetical protein